MSNLAILGEKRFNLSQAELVLIGGDGASWITSKSSKIP